MATLTIELPPQGAQTSFNLRRWDELLADPELAKVEGRIETDRPWPHPYEFCLPFLSAASRAAADLICFLGHLLLVRFKLRFWLRMLLAGMVCVAGFAARAAHTKTSLLLAADAAQPGETILAGVRLKMEPHWHTYWQNSGASGAPTKIEWQLPAGVSAGATRWPVPEKLPDEDLTTYIYKDEVVLLTPLTLDSNLASDPLELKAKVSW